MSWICYIATEFSRDRSLSSEVVPLCQQRQYDLALQEAQVLAETVSRTL